MQDDIQVEPETYADFAYDDEDRFVAYWNQIHIVLDLKPKSVLEVGMGNGFFSRYIREHGVGITTMDFDPRLGPDIQGNALTLPFRDECYDVVVSFEVLEHIRYDHFRTALNEMRRVAKRCVVISMPDASRTLLVNCNLYGIKNKWIRLPFPAGFRIKPHVFNGEHYWEIGKPGYELKKVVGDVEDSGLKVIRTERPNRAPFCRFFVLEKKDSRS